MDAPVTKEYYDAIARRESGQRLPLDSPERYSSINQFNYLGKYQMGTAALAEAGFYLGGIDKKFQNWNEQSWSFKAEVFGVTSSEEFRASPAAQEAAVRAFTDKNWRYIEKYGLVKYIGTEVDGVEITAEGLLAGTHLVGIGATIDFVKNKNEKKDGNGTSVKSYMKMFSPPSPFLAEDQKLLRQNSEIDVALAHSLSFSAQQESGTNTSYQSQSEISRLARAERSAAEAKAEAASQAAREAFRASETEYTNSQGSSSGGSGWSGWNSGPDQSSAESARLSRSGSTGDPIVIDLDGNGIELYSRNNSPAHFDFDDDGYSETTAWAGPQDGILVIDEGNDNQITQSKEIAFAKWTAAEGDTDLEGLAATFDSNHDGVLDARDQRFADFKVWKDANSNGVVDAGEMQTLAEAGIKSFNLQVKDGTNLDLEDGSVIHGLFDIQRADGKTIQGADVSLAYNSQGYRTRTDAAGNTVVEFESGSALHYRNIADSEGSVDFNLGSEADTTVWIGASGNASANTLNASSKTTEVLLDGGAGDDTLLGGSGDDLLVGGEGADQLRGGAGNDQLFVDGADLAALTSLTGSAKSTRINGGEGYDSLVVLDNSQVNLVVDDIGVEAVIAGGANDNITGALNTANYVFDGGAGNDSLTTVGGNDVLLGGAGNDTLKSGAGTDVLAGGAGDDRLEGGAGNDVYVFNRGDGADRILDYAEDWYKERYSYQEQVSYSEQYDYYESVYHGDGKSGSYVNELRTGYRAATRLSLIHI